MTLPVPGRVATRASAAEAEFLAGLVERVTFHNAENGFCVLRVKARGQRDLTPSLVTRHSFQPASSSTAFIPRGGGDGDRRVGRGGDD